MLTTSEPAMRIRLSSFCLLLLLILSCGSKDQVIGTYRADPGDSPHPVETVMELKANGEGIWRVGDEEVSFAWYIKDGELRVNTKGGGVIVGTLDKGTIRISLAGTGIIVFEKVRRPAH